MIKTYAISIKSFDIQRTGHFNLGLNLHPSINFKIYRVRMQSMHGGILGNRGHISVNIRFGKMLRIMIPYRDRIKRIGIPCRIVLQSHIAADHKARIIVRRIDLNKLLGRAADVSGNRFVLSRIHIHRSLHFVSQRHACEASDGEQRRH